MLEARGTWLARAGREGRAAGCSSLPPLLRHPEAGGWGTRGDNLSTAVG